jgi:hypothetical protein
MIAAFSSADQLRRRPAPVNTSMRRTGSGICLCAEIDKCRSPHRLRDSPFCRHAKGGAQTPLTLYPPPTAKENAGMIEVVRVAADDRSRFKSLPSTHRASRFRSIDMAPSNYAATMAQSALACQFAV